MLHLLILDFNRIVEFRGKHSAMGYLMALFSLSFSAVFLIRSAFYFNRFTFLAPISKLIQLILFFAFKITYSPKVVIGSGLFLPHPQNIVFGCISIGSNVTIMQSVTLGAKILDNQFNAALRPKVENNVFIGAHALILGGGSIETNARVNAGSVVFL